MPAHAGVCTTAPIVVIGAGLAGWTTVRELRRLDPVTPVLLITADRGDFYAKPSLSNAFAQRRTPAQLVTTEAQAMAARSQVTLLAHTRVLAIDPAAQTVTTHHGVQPYRDLVLASGAQPIRLALAGNAATEVLSVNSLADFEHFHARLTAGDDAPPVDKTASPRRVLIMGAGLIGCEFANDLAACGYAVQVVDPAGAPMAALLPPAASDALRAALAGLGVVWHFGTAVQAVAAGPSPADGLQVTLANGVSVQADLVLSAIGLRADTSLAQAAGLHCERGIVVDTALQTSAAHVYALGDGAQYASAGGRTLPYVMPIMQAAKALALTLSGQPNALSFALMPVAIKTPALPIVVAAPAPGITGSWQLADAGIWHFVDAQGRRRGFALAGQQTAQRNEQSRQLQGMA